METKSKWLCQGSLIREGVTQELAFELGSLGLNGLYRMEAVGVRKESRCILTKGLIKAQESQPKPALCSLSTLATLESCFPSGIY